MTPWPRHSDGTKFAGLRNVARSVALAVVVFWGAVATLASWAVFR